MEEGQATYCLYARKSSESDERQAMSIDSQIKEMQVLAERDGIFIKEIRQESHSAKESGARPVFAQLLKDIKLGLFTGILTWAPDRLSRNAGDLGIIVDLMDQGRLQKIKTYGQIFANTPNDKFLLMILCSQAKLENDNKGVNVKRGIRAKCEMGWRPSPAPLGYMNRAFGGIKDIIIDPERGPIIKEAFEKAAYVYHNCRMIKEWMDKQGFTTRNGKNVTKSMVYHMLKNPFYYGTFEFPLKSGKWWKGSHEPLITKEVYDEVQKELTLPRKRTTWGTKTFAFKGLFKCFSCGSNVVSEEKFRKRKMKAPRHHIYYHCSRFKDRNCKEGYVEEKELIKLLCRLIDEVDETKITIPESLKETMGIYKKLVFDTIYANTDRLEEEIEISLKDYAKYILKDSPPKAKNDLVLLLPIPRKLHNRNLI